MRCETLSSIKSDSFGNWPARMSLHFAFSDYMTFQIGSTEFHRHLIKTYFEPIFFGNLTPAEYLYSDSQI